MTKITELFPITQEQINNSVEFSKFFLGKIKEYPGVKVGVIGRSQSGTTTCFDYLKALSSTGVDGRAVASYSDNRDVLETFIGTLNNIEDLTAVVKSQIPDWYSMFEAQNIVPGEPFTVDPAFSAQAINKVINEAEDSRKMWNWKAALTIWCLRDLRSANIIQDPNRLEFFELPYLPINYNQYFDKLILIERRPNWFSDPLFQEHFQSEGLDAATETSLISVRDAEFDDYRNASNWSFDHTIVNDGTVEELHAKILNVIKEMA